MPFMVRGAILTTTVLKACFSFFPLLIAPMKELLKKKKLEGGTKILQWILKEIRLP